MKASKCGIILAHWWTSPVSNPELSSCVLQTWNTAFLEKLRRRLIGITRFPCHHIISNQKPHRSCPPDRVPRGRMTSLDILLGLKWNVFGKIAPYEGNRVINQTFFMFPIVLRYYWYKTVINTCFNGKKESCIKRLKRLRRRQAFHVRSINNV